VTLPAVTHAERERSIFIGFVLALCLLIPCVVAAYIAKSLTLVVDILISLAETLASLLSWIIIRRVARGRNHDFNYGFDKLENISGLGVAAVMLVSFMVVVVEGIDRLRSPVAIVESGVILGFAITTFAAVSDTWLWFKNLRLARRQSSPLMEAQWRFFRSVRLHGASSPRSAAPPLQAYAWSIYIDTPPRAVSFLGLGNMIAADSMTTCSIERWTSRCRSRSTACSSRISTPTTTCTACAPAAPAARSISKSSSSSTDKSAWPTCRWPSIC
jgi:hypothetical protein